MSKKPFVTYHVNTFNRMHLLKNLLLSFEECNEYENFEWVILDYGSTDGTRDFVYDFMKDRDYVSAVFGNEKKYFEILKQKDLHPRTKRKQAHSIFGLSRNVARKVGRGDFFIDIADDHQFIRKCDWVSEMLDIFDHRRSIHGQDDIASIVYRGLSHARIMKPNNACHPGESTDSGIEYYRCIEKRYDDYHMMSRSMYDTIGDYFEVEKMASEDRIGDWKQGIDSFCQYRDYLQRANAMNLQKVFMKYPCVVDFPNYVHDKLDVYHEDLIVPIFESGKMETMFKDLDRPVSSDEIFSQMATQ